MLPSVHKHGAALQLFDACCLQFCVAWPAGVQSTVLHDWPPDGAQSKNASFEPVALTLHRAPAAQRRRHLGDEHATAHTG